MDNSLKTVTFNDDTKIQVYEKHEAEQKNVNSKLSIRWKLCLLAIALILFTGLSLLFPYEF
ncbi:MAG: hypothetical protein Edafosvirus1_110 [Edafosvirus sp.]|uniref:Uncharacterized protein n=1 Tax=Edafosvirus sp. TaxID=2487765 RepID=A0A3G4ZWH2_9VIRU|nr:MAG: hypothetical protein Edafosvirus1_110 [Edafosvirus sp.]